MLDGSRVRLEPVSREAHAADLYAELHQDPSGRQWTYLPYGPFADADALGAFPAADPELVTYAIVVADTGRAEGMASYARISPLIGSIEVGGIIYGPALVRSAAATEAMYLLAANAFDRLGYRRYEWKCDSLNEASMAAARRLGFRYEGTWRNATMYKGRNRDTAWFSITDEEWLVIGPRIAAWLDPANFVGGRQIRSLSAWQGPNPGLP